MTHRRLAALAAAAAVTAVLTSPISCSQGSADPRPHCETVLGYWTPFRSEVQLLLLLALVLAVKAVRRSR